MERRDFDILARELVSSFGDERLLDLFTVKGSDIVDAVFSGADRKGLTEAFGAATHAVDLEFGPAETRDTLKLVEVVWSAYDALRGAGAGASVVAERVRQSLVKAQLRPDEAQAVASTLEARLRQGFR
jgi:hypothetical protein